MKNLDSQASLFVNYIFQTKDQDSALRARLRNAFVPLRESQAWFDVANFCDISNEKERKIYLLIGYAIAHDLANVNGVIPIGKAILESWKEKSVRDSSVDINNPGAKRLRKLLACSNVLDLCEKLRPIIRTIQSKGFETINYAELLTDLLIFEHNPNFVKTKWAKNFFDSASGEKK